jgi:hypothetical protein
MMSLAGFRGGNRPVDLEKGARRVRRYPYRRLSEAISARRPEQLGSSPSTFSISTTMIFAAAR